MAPRSYRDEKGNLVSPDGKILQQGTGRGSDADVAAEWYTYMHVNAWTYSRNHEPPSAQRHDATVHCLALTSSTLKGLRNKKRQRPTRRRKH